MKFLQKPWVFILFITVISPFVYFSSIIRTEAPVTAAIAVSVLLYVVIFLCTKIVRHIREAD